MAKVKPDKCPDRKGRFGKFGGRYVPETVMSALQELDICYKKLSRETGFRKELKYYLSKYAGRPTPLYLAERLTRHIGRGKIYFKREDLNHTGAHKINNTIGQILLARRMGKRRIIAETGAGQHGLATATVAARFGMKCIVYMGELDIRRQALNVYKMRMLGTEVIPVRSGSRTLKDATNEALRDWVTNVADTFYIIGSVVGPHPYPMIVRDFQSVIGRETKVQFKKETGELPSALVACVGGGSNAIGLFHPFLKDKSVRMYGIEAAGLGVKSGRHAATILRGKPGVLHGCYSYLLYDREGQVILPHSVSAGLDYPGVGPEHSFLHESGRVLYYSATDMEALRAFHLVTRLEGILPALETAHALAFLIKHRKKFDARDNIIVCFSGRGDKDIDIIRDAEKGRVGR
jgi:tryptophan synthase beta chain